jgi:hypothetical protein
MKERVVPALAEINKKEENLETIKKKMCARALVLGFEPFEIADIEKVSIITIRDWIKRDPEFRELVSGLEEELFGAIEKKYQRVMKEALNALSDLLDREKNPDPEMRIQAIDRTFRIHGKYIERTEDVTPPMRKLDPATAERLLEKGIEYLKLSKGNGNGENQLIEMEDN